MEEAEACDDGIDCLAILKSIFVNRNHRDEVLSCFSLTVANPEAGPRGHAPPALKN